MQLQAAQGRPGAVRRTLALLESRLGDAGLTPGDSTRQLAAALLGAGQPAPAAAGEDRPYGRTLPPGAMSGEKGNPHRSEPRPATTPRPGSTRCRQPRYRQHAGTPEPGAADPPREAGPRVGTRTDLDEHRELAFSG